MGYFDTITVSGKNDIVIGDITIKNKCYQSKDFMYDENGRYWQGDSYEIVENGFIYFVEEELKKTKITGLINIYSQDFGYWLLVEQNKIIKVYPDVPYDFLPNEAKKSLGVFFGENDALNINLKKLTLKFKPRLLKKKEKKKKYNKFSNCKKTKELKRKYRKKSLFHKNLLICIEQKKPFYVFDEAGAYPFDISKIFS